MIEWSEQHLAIREAFRRFIDSEIRPRVDEFEHDGVPPYAVLRKMIATFGMAEMRRARAEQPDAIDAGDAAAMQLIPNCRACARAW